MEHIAPSGINQSQYGYAVLIIRACLDILKTLPVFIAVWLVVALSAMYDESAVVDQFVHLLHIFTILKVTQFIS